MALGIAAFSIILVGLVFYALPRRRQRVEQELSSASETKTHDAETCGKLKAVLEALPQEASYAECAICLNNFEEDQRPAVRLPCGGTAAHVMHFECMSKWLGAGGSSCPLCKGSLLDPPKEDDLEAGVVA